uniref:Uncharacterized protein n=1 Tax=Bartonella schoenbuchensis (strain DSM 13525 / NCTC 13165 / R1) TaxID=687861 RepID=E6YYH5_BARSR|nr:hypothetical protein B11C_20263 [Bartonella schoenbuchensis R1]
MICKRHYQITKILIPYKELTKVFDSIHDVVKDVHDSLDVNTIFHKLEKDKNVFYMR